jgi:hypothetical protein
LIAASIDPRVSQSIQRACFKHAAFGGGLDSDSSCSNRHRSFHHRGSIQHCECRVYCWSGLHRRIRRPCPLAHVGVASAGYLFASAGAVGLAVGLLLALSENMSAALGGWFIAGASCGLLKLYGNLQAATSPVPTLAFSIRLAFVLTIAGGASLVTAVGEYYLSCEASVLFLLTLLIFILVTGLAFSAVLEKQRIPPNTPQATSEPGLALLGLAMTSTFFVGQVGFVSYVIHTLQSNAISLRDAVIVFGIAKLGGGIYLAAFSQLHRSGSTLSALLHGIALAVATAATYYNQGFLSVGVCLVALQIALNGLSAQFQGAVVSVAPTIGGQWLGAAILLGAAAGGPLNGLAIDKDLGWLFLVFSTSCAMIPVIWRVYCSKQL